MAGSVIGGQVVEALQDIVDAKASAPLFNAQFAAYGTFMSFFGLADLPKAGDDFYGICNYASSMAFELLTTSGDAKPKADDINVRFLFANGTADADLLKPFPLFGQKETTLSWNDFKSGMGAFSIQGKDAWRKVCGNESTADVGSDGGMSRPVAGVVGACVTLGVVLLVLAALGLCGMRMVRKPTAKAIHAAKMEEVEA